MRNSLEVSLILDADLLSLKRGSFLAYVLTRITFKYTSGAAGYTRLLLLPTSEENQIFCLPSVVILPNSYVYAWAVENRVSRQ